MRRLLALSLAAGVLSGTARAAWVGNPTQSVEKGAVVLGYQAGSRDVESTTGGGGNTLELKSRGLVLEQRTSINPVVHVALRVLPFTGRVNLQGDAFNPHLAGAGVGLYASPPEPLGLVRLGGALIWDGAGGARRRPGSGSGTYDRVYWSETTVAAGASVSPAESVNAYGGVAYVSLRTRFNQSGVKATFKETSPWGGFLGASWLPNKAWFANAEARVGGERGANVSLGYKY